MQWAHITNELCPWVQVRVVLLHGCFERGEPLGITGFFQTALLVGVSIELTSVPLQLLLIIQRYSSADRDLERTTVELQSTTLSADRKVTLKEHLVVALVPTVNGLLPGGGPVEKPLLEAVGTHGDVVVIRHLQRVISTVRKPAGANSRVQG
jgi:hypothetical protein